MKLFVSFDSRHGTEATNCRCRCLDCWGIEPDSDFSGVLRIVPPSKDFRRRRRARARHAQRLGRRRFRTWPSR